MANVTYKEISDLVLDELHVSLGAIKEEEVEQLIDIVLGARKVFFIGVGRVMLSLQAIAKRWNHLGIDCHLVGEITEAEVLDSGAVLTLKAFSERGRIAPANATVVRTMESNTYRCLLCGYIYEGESLPEDYKCPICRAPASKFVKQD